MYVLFIGYIHQNCTNLCDLRAPLVVFAYSYTNSRSRDTHMPTFTRSLIMPSRRNLHGKKECVIVWYNIHVHPVEDISRNAFNIRQMYYLMMINISYTQDQKKGKSKKSIMTTPLFQNLTWGGSDIILYSLISLQTLNGCTGLFFISLFLSSVENYAN